MSSRYRSGVFTEMVVIGDRVLEVTFYFTPYDPGVITGPYDQAVEPCQEYYEIKSTVDLSTGLEIDLSTEDTERLIQVLKEM